MQAKGPLMSLRRPSKHLCDIKNLLKVHRTVPKTLSWLCPARLAWPCGSLGPMAPRGLGAARNVNMFGTLNLLAQPGGQTGRTSWPMGVPGEAACGLTGLHICPRWFAPSAAQGGPLSAP